MYHVIFKNIDEVKRILASYNIEPVDENRIFELLETYKTTEAVVEILLKSRSRPEPDLVISPWANKAGTSTQHEDRRSQFCPCSTTEIDITYDDVEVIEHKLARPVLLDEDFNQTVVIDDEILQATIDMLEIINPEPEMLQGTKAAAAISNVTNDDQRILNETNEKPTDFEKMVENCLEKKSDVVEIGAAKQDAEKMQEEKAVERSIDSAESVLDLTKDGSAEKETQKEGAVASSKDTIDSKAEDMDENNSDSGSEVEMDDDYYRTIELEDSEGFAESDEKVSIPPSSPILRLRDEAAFPNYQNQNNEASNLGQGENRMEEMLEENNNDPNNNLEDSEVLDQNIAASTVARTSAAPEGVIIEERSSSPKPGCSKDYTDFVANKTPRDDATLISDLNSIKAALPRFTEVEIMALLIKNIDASNRVELVLWDLLPDERPLPMLCTKRKLNEDSNPYPVKKFVQDKSKSGKEVREVTAPSKEAPKKESMELERNGIVKPAKLKLSDASKYIVQPAKLGFMNSSSHPQRPWRSIPKPGVTLKPSKLDHLTMQAQSEPAKRPTTLIDEFENLKETYFSNYDAPATASRSSKSTGTIPKKRPETKSTVLEDQNHLMKRKVVTKSVIPATRTNSDTMNVYHYGNVYKDLVVRSCHVDPRPELDAWMFPPTHKSQSNYRHVNADVPLKAESRKTVWPQAVPLQRNLVVEMLQDVELSPKNTGLLQKQGDSSAHIGNTRDLQKKPQVSLPVTCPDVPSINPAPNNIAAAAGGAEKAKPVDMVRQVEKPDVQPPKELFNPLINIFPDVDPNHIAELCNEAKVRNQNLEYLVEILLVNGFRYPRIVNPDPEPQDLNPDTQYENLQGIFPDAHPEYLRAQAEKYYNDPEAMKNFVQSKLEVPDYPTMADYRKKMKHNEQIRQYTEDFCIEKFLQIFPDPFAHFENPKRLYKYNVIAFEFLKSHFRFNKVATIQRAYKNPKHPLHISLAAKELTSLGPDMKTKRGDKQIPTEDIPLLQEFAFVRHKLEIKDYVKEQKRKEKEEFKRLKANHELMECQCCYDAECMPSKCLTCSEGHIFCKACIKLGSATKIGDGQTQFPCFIDCKGEFTLPVLQKVLEPTTFSILLRKRQEEEVKAAGLEGLVSCPYCHFASIPPPEDKVFKCLNPECMKESCRLCKELNHVPLRCDEVTKGEEARRYLEEKMTEALVRKCYKCSRPFFKDEGCNKMTCPCGAKTCYICGQPVKDYTHFNGQGSDRTDLCPLWSDNNVLNAETVRVVAKAAEKEILKKNPHLKIDAKALMPTLPQASRGPHQDIANAHILPAHIRRT